MNAIRKAFVAGHFYPGDATELRATVEACLARAKPSTGPAPKAIIAPHAGYIYSGDVAASAYARIQPVQAQITRVILLGPCHRVPVRGLAVSSAEAYETPLGSVPIDTGLRDQALGLGQVQVYDATHAQEHSLEVHLPFLQVILGEGFTLLPLVVGDASPQDVAQVLDQLWGGPETLIVISSDLSHYLDYAAAQAMDGATCKAIEALDGSALGRDQACGRGPVKGLLEIAKQRGMSVETVDLRNSGDTAGPKDRVVGYGSWVFTEPDKPNAAAPETVQKPEPQSDGDFRSETRRLLEQHGATMMKTAISSIIHGLKTGNPALIDMNRAPDDLKALGACFVTLKKNNQLRGCIGSPEAHRPLIIDVAENAHRAAFQDPRFPPLSVAEWPDLGLSISVLSKQMEMRFESEQNLRNQLVPKEDGLVIADGGKRALFLPSVWEQLQTPEAFLGHLKVKAGLGKDHWSDQFKAYRFVALEIRTTSLPPLNP